MAKSKVILQQNTNPYSDLKPPSSNSGCGTYLKSKGKVGNLPHGAVENPIYLDIEFLPIRDLGRGSSQLEVFN
ncbi:hypothetical protein COLO4_19423 [Corchorus olitorius]|uniref:Uncharacterized protein n=1 Tax=Corchorus olitorius TaxID=93759 RepID=A0A1R3J5B4_9ROSI|nr:hypothetical protein COLO4_19423 [Corchorus olitorius]